MSCAQVQHLILPSCGGDLVANTLDGVTSPSTFSASESAKAGEAGEERSDTAWTGQAVTELTSFVKIHCLLLCSKLQLARAKGGTSVAG